MAQAKSERRGLGRGLSALMADVDPQPENNPAAPSPRKAEALIDIARISPNPDQPRRTFAEESMKELENSVREKGIIQPLILRTNPRDPVGYEIVAGERRWRAAQRAQLHEVPAIIREFDDAEVLEIAIIENIQRADLNPVDEAAGYRQLMDRFGHTQEKMAEALGKSRSHIANMLRLLNLPEQVLELLRGGALSMGHARALLTAEDPLDLAQRVVKRDLSVRDVEKLVKASKASASASSTSQPPKDADTRQIEKDLSAALGMKVSIDHVAGSEKGVLTVRYKDLEQLDEVCRRLSSTLDAGKV